MWSLRRLQLAATVNAFSLLCFTRQRLASQVRRRSIGMPSFSTSARVHHDDALHAVRERPSQEQYLNSDNENFESEDLEDDDLLQLVDESQGTQFGQLYSSRTAARDMTDSELRRVISEWTLCSVHVRSSHWFREDYNADKLPPWRARLRYDRLQAPNHLASSFTKAFKALHQDLTKNTLDNLFFAYMDLPHPRPRHVPPFQLEVFVNSYLASSKQMVDSKVQFQMLLEDIADCGMPISRYEFYSSLAYVAYSGPRHLPKYVLSRALDLFREFEQQGIIACDATPFNILMTTAIKCGRFEVVHRAVAEMRERKIRPDRYTYVNLMHYYGKIRDKKTLAKVYDRFVKSNEITDVVVLNAMITSLVRCRDIAGARNLLDYVESRALAEEWEVSRLTTRQQRMLTRNLKTISENRRTAVATRGAHIQSPEDTVRITPTEHLYIALMTYYTSIGDFDALADTVSRMDRFNLSRKWAYLLLFKGFYIHSGAPQSEWTLERFDKILEMIFDSSPTERVLDRAVSVWALRACCCLTTDMRKVELLKDRLLKRFKAEGGSLDHISGKIDTVMEESREYTRRFLQAKVLGTPKGRRKMPYFNVIS
ncbi:uncharacterized protein V1518DRAFT_411765 [Limtongia smithiae]|uniref:uncharacterized protein n=1 Tax=Limtongia smithiae TaxID=1125753 RepID=UPI0034CD698E